jgi:hypothetical protein
MAIELDGNIDTNFGENAKIVAGDDKSIVVTVNNDGSVYDLSSPTVNGITYEVLDDSGTSQFSKTQSGGGVTITDGAAGEITVTIDSGDTSGLSADDYTHEIELDDSDEGVSTLFQGNLRIDGDNI